MPEVPDPAVDPLATLTAVLKKLIPSPPSASLANSTEQYDTTSNYFASQWRVGSPCNI